MCHSLIRPHVNLKATEPKPDRWLGAGAGKTASWLMLGRIPGLDLSKQLLQHSVARHNYRRDNNLRLESLIADSSSAQRHLSRWYTCMPPCRCDTEQHREVHADCAAGCSEPKSCPAHTSGQGPPVEHNEVAGLGVGQCSQALEAL